MIYYIVGINGLQELQNFVLKLPRENCTNIHVVGASKKKLIGFISRRGEVPRSKQGVDMAKITRNEIFLHGLDSLAIHKES